VVRAVVFWAASLLLALWVLAGAVSLVDALLTDCGATASEISDPCAAGKGTFLLYGSLVWVAGALPLVLILLFLGRGRS
jgi:hypothetical protein